jgi:hypothetical protein
MLWLLLAALVDKARAALPRRLSVLAGTRLLLTLDPSVDASLLRGMLIARGHRVSDVLTYQPVPQLRAVRRLLVYVQKNDAIAFPTGVVVQPLGLHHFS